MVRADANPPFVSATIARLVLAWLAAKVIVAGNAALSGSDLVGSFAASGNNLTDGDPLLAPLGNYGGPTPTMPPLPGSPAIDAGSDDATNAPYSFATDQRGFPRWSGPHVDLGAVELVVGAPSITALTAVVIGTDAANGAALVQLSASVNPNNELSSMVYFQYGLTSTYAGTNGPISSPPMYSLFHATNLSVTVGLAPGFTYHWRAVAASSTYTTSTPDQTFHLTAPGIPGDSNGDGIVSQSEFAAVLANLHGNGIVSQSDLDLVLSNYWPHSPWLFMTNVAGLGAANVTFALGNSLAGAYSAEYTTNLTDWLPLGPATPRYQFTDTNAPALPQRFYRLRWP